MQKYGSSGLGDLEQKTSDDEREAYKNTPSEETTLEQKNIIKGEIRRISTFF